MTTRKIFANDIPLGQIRVKYADFVELVVNRGVRPERPDAEEAPQLSDGIWNLAEKCWVKDPKQRPTANDVCDVLSHLLDIPFLSRPPLDTSPSHTNFQPDPSHPSTSPSNLSA